MIETPSATGRNGRFQAGNQAAVGHSSRSQKLRHATLEAVSEADVLAVLTKLISLAKAGNLGAIKLLFDRVLGRVSVGEPPAGGDEADSTTAIERDMLAITGRIERLQREEPETHD